MTQTPVTDVAHQEWTAPVLVRVNTWTPDGRRMRRVDWRDLPLPLKWQKADQAGHDESVIVGRIDSISMADDTTVTAQGVIFADLPEAAEALYLAQQRALRGVSVDPGGVGPVEVTETEDGILLDFEWYTIGAATLVAVPAFPDAAIILAGYEDAPVTDEVPAAAPIVHVHLAEEAAIVEAITAAGTAIAPSPLAPDVGIFERPGLTKREPLHVEADGRVWGHIYGWGECHRGSPLGACVQAPRSRCNYGHFCSVGKGVLCADGTFVHTGTITLGGGHADKRLTAEAAIRHYDDASLAVADVVAGEDDFGIWVAGQVRPGVPDETIYALRASEVSGDWRQLDGHLELIAVHAVNMGGFVPKMSAYIDGGHVLSLIASGAPVEGPSACGCGGATEGQDPWMADRVAGMESKLDEVHRVVMEPIRQARLADLASSFSEDA